MTKILVLQHHPEEGLGSLQHILAAQKHQTEVHRLDLGVPVPDDLADYGALIIMGGPMSVHDTDQYPWLLTEQQIIRRAVSEELPVLGHCLGGQLIAQAMGGQITPNPDGPEIGWWPVTKNPEAMSSVWLQELPDTFTLFHWHGETFSLPSGAVPLLSSGLCTQQAFAIGKHCLALQGHPEVTPAMVQAWTESMADDLQQTGAGIQPSRTIHNHLEHKCEELLGSAVAIYRPWLGQLR
ncbi:type 1 glutamine amidotransferase [Acidithiobacillus sp.]|uniref:type 1 glutamine amidotransferase n=1 Tax=Acidithiobacillus sp. TaxID=1872118 RepID=UPI00263014FB|nr:type 1 glutamine amidotransferase [Acidithiobacillus sp.]